MTTVFHQIHQMVTHKEEALLLLQHFPVVRTLLMKPVKVKVRTCVLLSFIGSKLALEKVFILKCCHFSLAYFSL